jgi:hypothetical protein
VNDNVLIDRLALQVMHWRVGSDRFVSENRSWLPKWRFNPLERLADAFLLLDHSDSVRYVISQTSGKFQVKVEHNEKIGIATGTCRPRVITLAVARSLGLEV